MSHLMLDEIYAVEWKGGRWRFKKSFGTAIKFWGDDSWANFSTYAKLAIVVAMVLGEPTVMKQIEARNPQFARTYQEWQQRTGQTATTELPLSDELCNPAAQPKRAAVQQSASRRSAATSIRPSGRTSPFE